MDIRKRSLRALNIKQYSKKNKPENVGFIDVKIPKKRQYVLRMLIKKPFIDFKIPKDLLWCKDIIEKAYNYQLKMGINQPFCYLTVRNGEVNSITDDEWHVDGFSKTITHLPEQNYIWTDKIPTEYINKGIKFPKDFDSQKHNLHYFIQDNINIKDKVKTCKEKNLYCMDPYVIHKRPDGTDGVNRCFIRVSFTPIEIEDVNNTKNQLLETNYTRDGVNIFRDNLIRYK